MKQELDQADAGRPVYLLGESFGGILCLALAIKLGDYIDRVVLVNPASSFSDSIWPQAGPLLAQLPPDVYKLLPFALAPVLSNPISMAMNDVDDRAPLLQQGSDLLYVSTGLCLLPRYQGHLVYVSRFSYTVVVPMTVYIGHIRDVVLPHHLLLPHLLCVSRV